MPRRGLAWAFRLRGRCFDQQREGALLVRIQRAHADESMPDFLAAIVANRHCDRIFARFGVGGVPDAALDAQQRLRRHRGLIGGAGFVAQVVPTGRTNDRTLEDGLPAVRARARRPRGARADAAHEPAPLPVPWPLPGLPAFQPLLSSQPNSAWPRIRAPAATVTDRVLMSPINTAVCSKSTREASSMLPSSSPAIVTLSARTPPVSLAPTSMARSPWTLTSPLNLPAMRTLPPPSILPSMVMSEAISDSFRGKAVSIGAGATAGVGANAGFNGAYDWAGSLDSGAGVGGRRVAVLSFQMDIV